MAESMDVEQVEAGGLARPHSSPTYNYVVTAQQATAVTHAVVGHFTGPGDVNLILGKSTHIEIITLAPEGLQATLDIPVYGRISALRLFKPQAAARELLFVLTEHCRFFVLQYDPATGAPVTAASGDASDSIGRPVDNGQLGILDPECRAVGLHLYDGLLKVVPIDERGSLGSEMFNVRLEELGVIDMAFLAGCATPTVALLYEDAKHARHIKAYAVGLRSKDLEEAPLAHQNLDAGASMIIPVPAPLGGAIVVGEAVVTYFSAGPRQYQRTAALCQTVVRAWCQIDDDGSRYLLGDYLGGLHLLVLACVDGSVVGLKLQHLGTTSAASALCYLDNGVAFVGSRSGDHQLVRLHSEPGAVGVGGGPSYVEVLDSFTSLAPILDFAVQDMDRAGQGQLVMCCGTMRDGSLRVVRNGIGLNELNCVELAGIRGVWALRPGWRDAYDRLLVMAFVGETRLLAIDEDDELGEVELAGFDGGSQTLLCSNTLHDTLLQVTAAAVRLIDSAGGRCMAEWRPAEGRAISLAASSPTQVLLSTGGGALTYLEVQEGGLVERGAVVLLAEVACLDITPFGGSVESASLAAVGSWAMDVVLLRLPDLSPLATQPLGADQVIPRSVLLAGFEGAHHHLLVGLGDGALHSWRLDPATAALSDKKQIQLGTKPIQLRTFTSGGVSYVFAACDRPTIIYSQNRKLIYSNLNENEVNFMAPFNSASFPDSLAIAKEDSLTLGTIDAIQKLHIRSVPLGEQPRRLALQEATRTLAVATAGLLGGISPSGGAADRGQLLVFDDATYDRLAAYPLAAQELACSLASVSFAGDDTAYYALGTAVVKPEEYEPSKGRIVLLAYRGGGRLEVVESKEVKGAVYALQPFQGKLLASVNSKVHVFKWVPGGGGGAGGGGAAELVSETSTPVQVLSLYLAARGDFILVGDLMKSLTLLMYKAAEGSLEVRARDLDSKWLTALAALDDDTYALADNSHNLVVLRNNSDAATDEERARLQAVGCFHLGEFVNAMRHGSLVMRLPDSELASIPTLLFAGVEGAIGVMASLPQDLYAMLERLQGALAKTLPGVGGLDHGSWRAFRDERRSEGCRNFVDGDLVEAFLDLGPEQAAAVVGLMGPGFSVNDVTRKVEELQRLH
ncbi:MAG: mono-functional DNA-alkylating methyl methanesulfonate N-term-domain-containing protein [Monoraphidium minutum]|nr:MAG: mono-functional DNA-alkylating methyl methanesulfonate N-term-domain-containing protein [Monoraphidium minutum]